MGHIWVDIETQFIYLFYEQVAEQTGCHGDLLEDDLAPCLRNKPLSELLAVRLEPPRFLPGFAPFVDGTVIVNPSSVSGNYVLLLF